MYTSDIFLIEMKINFISRVNIRFLIFVNICIYLFWYMYTYIFILIYVYIIMLTLKNVCLYYWYLCIRIYKNRKNDNSKNKLPTYVYLHQIFFDQNENKLHFSYEY